MRFNLSRMSLVFLLMKPGTGRSPVEVLAEPVIDISRVDVTRSKMIYYFFFDEIREPGVLPVEVLVEPVIDETRYYL